MGYEERGTEEEGGRNGEAERSSGGKRDRHLERAGSN